MPDEIEYSFEELKEILDEAYDYYDQRAFIDSDPICVPHTFGRREDIEISGFLTAILAWGRRETIISNSFKLMEAMPGGPYEFLMEAGEAQLETFLDFKHRTFNGTDCFFFLRSLKNIYTNHGGLKQVFEEGYREGGNIPSAIRYFRNIFFSIVFPGRTLKHIPDIDNKAAAKRMNMFLRWMVRRDERGVDFGLWDRIPPSTLYIPLDVHSGKIARELGLLHRKQNDWRAVNELTHALRKFDRDDPVKYDFALFGLGAMGNIPGKNGK